MCMGNCARACVCAYACVRIRGHVRVRMRARVHVRMRMRLRVNPARGRSPRWPPTATFMRRCAAAACAFELMIILTTDGPNEQSVRWLQNVLVLWCVVMVLDLDGVEKIHYCPATRRTTHTSAHALAQPFGSAPLSLCLACCSPLLSKWQNRKIGSDFYYAMNLIVILLFQRYIAQLYTKDLHFFWQMVSVNVHVHVRVHV